MSRHTGVERGPDNRLSYKSASINRFILVADRSRRSGAEHHAKNLLPDSKQTQNSSINKKIVCNPLDERLWKKTAHFRSQYPGSIGGAKK